MPLLEQAGIPISKCATHLVHEMWSKQVQVALSFDAWKKILIKSKMNYLIICIYRSSFRNLIDFFKCIKKEEVGCNVAISSSYRIQKLKLIDWLICCDNFPLAHHRSTFTSLDSFPSFSASCSIIESSREIDYLLVQNSKIKSILIQKAKLPT